jgi:hypothetical protein
MILFRVFGSPLFFLIWRLDVDLQVFYLVWTHSEPLKSLKMLLGRSGKIFGRINFRSHPSFCQWEFLCAEAGLPHCPSEFQLLLQTNTLRGAALLQRHPAPQCTCVRVWRRPKTSPTKIWQAWQRMVAQSLVGKNVTKICRSIGYQADSAPENCSDATCIMAAKWE